MTPFIIFAVLTVLFLASTVFFFMQARKLKKSPNAVGQAELVKNADYNSGATSKADDA